MSVWTRGTDRMHSKALRRVGKQSVSSACKITDPFDNARRKQGVWGVRLDIRAIAITTPKKWLGVPRLFILWICACNTVKPKQLLSVLRHRMIDLAPDFVRKRLKNLNTPLRLTTTMIETLNFLVRDLLAVVGVVEFVRWWAGLARWDLVVFISQCDYNANGDSSAIPIRALYVFVAHRLLYMRMIDVMMRFHCSHSFGDGTIAISDTKKALLLIKIQAAWTVLEWLNRIDIAFVTRGTQVLFWPEEAFF